MRLVKEKIKYIYEAGLENMIVLVSTRVGSKNYVMTSGTVTEVSHEPPMLLSSIAPERFTHDRIIEREAFAINLLTTRQKMLAKLCGSSSGRDVDKFALYNINYFLSKGELPFIQGCLANIGCRLVATYTCGDHTLLVGEMFESVVYGERQVGHLLLSDMKRNMPRALSMMVSKLPLAHWLNRRFKRTKGT